MGEREINRVKNLIYEQKIFLVVDESEICGNKYLNILVGLLDEPDTTYLIACKVLPKSSYAQSICQEIDDCLRFLDVTRNNFCLLLSDAARYMQVAGKTLKNMYPQLFHVTCIAHLLHNRALLVKAKYPTVDDLIACVKAATVKNKTRQAMFEAIGKPPQSITTRWAMGKLVASGFLLCHQSSICKRYRGQIRRFWSCSGASQGQYQCTKPTSRLNENKHRM